MVRGRKEGAWGERTQSLEMHLPSALPKSSAHFSNQGYRRTGPTDHGLEFQGQERTSVICDDMEAARGALC